MFYIKYFYVCSCVGEKHAVCCKAIIKSERPVSLWVEDVNEECVLVDKHTVCKQVVSLTEHFSESDHRMCTELRLFINNKTNYRVC